VFPGKICWVGEGRARGANNDHFARNGFEVSAEMDAALERDDRVLGHDLTADGVHRAEPRAEQASGLLGWPAPYVDHAPESAAELAPVWHSPWSDPVAAT
jgi:hypothetical protein